ncbi:hypothetical protein ACOMHN_001247 [Nucella lapillus]
MNILPKKSWHVRTKKNIERVRRDEEKAAEEEKERQRRIALAEQEARTEVLRDQSRKRQHAPEIEASSATTPQVIEGSGSGSEGNRKLARSSANLSLDQGGHLNFFKDIEEGLRREGKNAEHEAEKAAEKEKWEKNVGVLTYLGQSAIEAQNDKPWYLHRSESERTAGPCDPKKSQKEERDRKLKDSMDPLRDLKRHLEKRHQHPPTQKSNHRSQPKRSKHDRCPPPSSTKPPPSPSALSPSPPTSKTSRTMEELRAERLRRETAERQRVAAVMVRARGERSEPSGHEELVTDSDRDRARGYNSRYNPGFVKLVSHRRR